VEDYSFKTSLKKEPWYNKDGKISRKDIRHTLNESQKGIKIKVYKILVKINKHQYLNKI
jgi:hypothetical protein